MKNKKLLYVLAGVVGCAVLVVVFVFAKNGGNLTGSLINVSPVAKLNQSVLKLDNSSLKIVGTKIGSTSVTLSVNNANLSSPYVYAADCFNPKNNEFSDYKVEYLPLPAANSPGQPVNITVGSLTSGTAYICEVKVALKDGIGAYQMSRASSQIGVTTK